MSLTIEQQLKGKGIKPTAMRLLVLKILNEQKNAISLIELENTFDQADKSTLFRTLKTFEKNKLIHHIDDGSGSVKYAICEENCDNEHIDKHIHFVCDKCKRTFCIDEIELPPVTMPNNFILRDIQLLAKGVCDECNK